MSIWSAARKFNEGEIVTDLNFDSDKLVVRRVQDVEPIMDHAKFLSEQSQVGADFHHRWSLPNVMVEQFYNEYCGAGYKPMDQEFWEWVHKKMKDPQYKAFWTYNPSNPGWLGYGSR